MNVCLGLSSQNIGYSRSAEGDIKSLRNYHPTFKELKSGAAVGGGSLEKRLSPDIHRGH